jgi:hypothetical protein
MPTLVSRLLNPQEPRIKGFLDGIAATLVVLLVCIVGWFLVGPGGPYQQGQDFRAVLLDDDPNYGSQDFNGYMPESVIDEICWRKAYSIWGDPIDSDWPNSQSHEFMAGCRNVSVKRASR